MASLARTTHATTARPDPVGAASTVAAARAGASAAGAVAPGIGRVRYTRTRTVAIAPSVLERHRVAAVSDDHAKSDPFRMLRTQLLLLMRKQGWQTLAVTSPNKGAGKTTLSLNLAIGFGMEHDHTSLLVDADLRDPDVRHMLELGAGPGVVDYLTGKAPLEGLLIHPGLGNLVVLPGGAPVHESSELMRSPMMGDLVRELRGRYPDRLVVFDVPPVLASADTLAISAYIDATLLVVEERGTSREDIREACELLRHSNLVGVLLNKSRELRDAEPITRARPGFIRRLFGAEA
jgi:capsular exopolysaccharide synthesis family protein